MRKTLIYTGIRLAFLTLVFGISAGYGYSGAWNLYIGIGIQRNLFTW